MKDRLLKTCLDAAANLRQNGLEEEAKVWDRRAEQVREGIVNEAGFARYLRFGADYYQLKDRKYAEYLESLAGTML